MREISFHQRRQHHVGEGNGGADQDAARPEHGVLRQGTQRDAADQQREGEAQGALDADAFRQRRSQRRENGEQDQRQRVDQAGGGGGQRQLLLDLLQQWANAGQGGAQVGRDQHNADDQQDRAV